MNSRDGNDGKKYYNITKNTMEKIMNIFIWSINFVAFLSLMMSLYIILSKNLGIEIQDVLIISFFASLNLLASIYFFKK